MAGHRKLGRKSDHRISMLRNQVTSLLLNGQITTTVTRAKEVEQIAEKLITLAVKEKDNYTTREVIASAAKLDSKGHKLLKSKTSKSGNRYDVVERELKTKMVQVDNPSRLAARRQILKWLVRSQAKSNSKQSTVTEAQKNPSNYLFEQVAPRYVDRTGGYTRLIRLGQRRGDGAEMARIELV